MAVAIFCSAVAGCSDSTDTGYEDYGTTECAITSVILGTLNRTMHTTGASGQDSTYVVSLTGSYYPMYIDQRQNTIYNGDSLPYGTDVAHVTFKTFNTLGSVAIRSLSSLQDTIFSTTDSTNFTTPRVFTVYNNYSSLQRAYSMKINVHKEDGDIFKWKKVVEGNAMLAALEGTRLFVANGTLYVFGTENGTPVLMTAAATRPAEWSRVELNVTGLETAGMQMLGGTFYALAGGQVVSSTNGTDWVQNGSFAPDALVAAGSKALFGIKDNKIYHTTDGQSWTEDEADTPEALKGQSFASAYWASKTDTTFENIVFVGEDGLKPTVWKRTYDLRGHEDFGWFSYPATNDNPIYAPALGNAQAVCYDGKMLLLGQKPEGGVSPIYCSADEGRTWKADSIACPTPKFADNASDAAMAVGSDNMIWIICATSGNVWRGRHNRMGWAEQQYEFTRRPVARVAGAR